MRAFPFAYTNQELLLAEERQKNSIPHFTTRQRLSLKFKADTEKLLLYDSDINDFFFAYWSPSGTIFERVKDPSPVGPDETNRVVEEIVAATNLPAFTPIFNDGLIADSSIVNKRHRVVGVTLETIPFGSAGKYCSFGIVTNPAWTFPTTGNLFLDGQSLSITKPNSGFVLNMGKILSPDTVNINILYAIRL